jgi:hypothetical protein
MTAYMDAYVDDDVGDDITIPAHLLQPTSKMGHFSHLLSIFSLFFNLFIFSAYYYSTYNIQPIIISHIQERYGPYRQTCFQLHMN